MATRAPRRGVPSRTSAAIAWRARALALARDRKPAAGALRTHHAAKPHASAAATRRASASASSPGATPHRFWPTLTSTRTPTVTPARVARGGHLLEPGDRIGGDRDRSAARQRRHAVALAGPMISLAMRMSSTTDDDLGLGDRGARQAGDRPGGELAAGDLRRLVRLEVRAKPARAVGEEPRHPLNVAVHAPRHRRRAPASECRRRRADGSRTGERRWLQPGDLRVEHFAH